MVTLKEIAAELGVSVSMISRVLTDKDRVDPEKRKMIQEALERYHYVPNEMARGLRGIASRSIGIIVPTLASNYFTRIITAAQEEAQRNGFTTVVCCSGYDPRREQDAVQLLKNKQIRRVMCASLLPNPADFYFRTFGANAVVLFDSDAVPRDGVGLICFDSYSAAQKLADYQLMLGHRAFLILNHTRKMARQDGFLAALAANGISVPADRIRSELRNPETGYDVCLQLFSNAQHRPTAVLATNDALAYAAIRAAYQARLRVPGDVSVACFDACDETGILSPTLTCMMQPANEIGALCVQQLIAGACTHIVVETTFVRGTSCAAPCE